MEWPCRNSRAILYHFIVRQDQILKNKKIYYGTFIIVVLILICICGFVCFRPQKESYENIPEDKNTINSEESISEDLVDNTEGIMGYNSMYKEEISLGDDLYITSIGSYSGLYVEDGDNRMTEDIMAVMIQNRGVLGLSYTELLIEAGGENYNFSLSTIPAGESVFVMEQNEKKYKEEKQYTASLNHTVFFEDGYSMYEDHFQFLPSENGILNIQNIGEQIDSDIYVYYKNVMNDMYFGGITYRAKIDRGLKPDELRQIFTQHYNLEGSELLFITYEE